MLREERSNTINNGRFKFSKDYLVLDMKYDIFVSYSRKDIEKVRPVTDELEARDFKIWLDLSNIVYGDTFPDRIAEALDDSDSVLFLCTQNSLTAPYCKKEIGYARTNGKKIRAILIDGKMPKKGWFALDYLDVNCINFTKEEQKSKFFEELELVYQPQKAIEREKKINEAKEAVRKRIREEEERRIKEEEQKAREEELARLRKENKKQLHRKSIYLGMKSRLQKMRDRISCTIRQIFVNSMVFFSKLKKRLFTPVIYVPLLFVFLIASSIYIWRNKYDLFPSMFSLEERLGYAEVGESIDGYRLVKTYGGKLAFIQANEPWNLCTDTIFTDCTVMEDSVAWLKDDKTSFWNCFYAGQIRDISLYTQIVEFPSEDSITFFLFNKEVLKKPFLSNSEYDELHKKITELEKKRDKERNQSANSTDWSECNVTAQKRQKALSTNNSETSWSANKSVLDSLSKKIALYANSYIPSLQDTLTIDSLKMHYGVINKTGDVIIPPVIDGIGERTPLYAVARQNDLWGLVLYQKHRLPEFEYENLFAYESRDYANVKKNGKWGLIDKNNKVIIKIENDSLGLYDSYNGLIRVKYKGLWGFKDVNDKYIIKPIYREMHEFRFGYAAVQDNRTGKWFYINKENKPLSITINGITTSEPYFDESFDFSLKWCADNDTIRLARVVRENKTGYIRLYLDFATQFTRCEYDDLSTLDVKGFCKYKKGDKYGILYYSTEKTQPIYDYISYGKSGGVYEITANTKTGALQLDNDGNVSHVVPLSYESLDDYSYNCYKVKKNGKWGLYSISKKNEVIPCDYCDITLKDKRYCFIKKQESLYSKKTGLYSVKDQKWVLPCNYYSIELNENSTLAKVTKTNNERGVFDLNTNKWIGNGPVYESTIIYSDEVVLYDKSHTWSRYPIKK